MASSQREKPQSFYLKCESVAIEHKIKAMRGELEYIKQVKKQLGMVKEEKALDIFKKS